jgi:ATP-binding cassette subfamily B protein
MSRSKTLEQSLPSLWRVFLTLRPYIARHRLLVAGSAAALLASVGFRVLEPWPLKIVFDYVLAISPTVASDSVRPADATLLVRTGPMALLLFAALGVIAVTGLRAVADYCHTVGFALTSNRVLSELRADVYDHLQSLSLSFHARARSGDLIVRVIGDVGMLKDAAVSAALPLGVNLLSLVGMIGVMLWIEWRLALLALVIVPLFWLATVRVGGRVREVSRVQRQREGAMAATASEAIGAIKNVQALSLERLFSQSFAAENRRSVKDGVKATRLIARLERTVDVLIATATALVLWGGARLVLAGTLSPGELVVFLAYLKTAFRPVRDLAKYTGRLAKAAAAGERVLDLLDRTPDVGDLPGALPAPQFRGSVQFDNVSFGYEPGRLVLREIEFQVEAGQRVALVGRSGIGKSTLVSLLQRLYDPTAGRVFIDGRDVRSYTIASLRSQISVVLQDSVLFAASVSQNIACGIAGATQQSIEVAARLANAHEFIEALPRGYGTVIGERGVTLSLGQRQRIAIARAAIRQTPILILDEPTMGLDEENERSVLEAIERLTAGRTTYLITHDLRVAAQADLILHLVAGRLVERGSHAELLQSGGRYATLYHLQVAHGNREEMTRAIPQPA